VATLTDVSVPGKRPRGFSTLLGLVIVTTLLGPASVQAGSTPSLRPEVVAPSCFNRDLARGSRGGDVALLQVALGYLNLRRGRVDGIYGSATRSAWMRWERIVGSRVDGIASLGELAWGACDVPAATTTPDPTAHEPVVVQPTVVQQPVVVQQTNEPPVPQQQESSVSIPSIGMTRPIIVGYASQAAINSCRGAVLFDGGWPGSSTGMYLAAHRTSCGNMGFNGIQDLPAGTLISIRHDGITTTFAVQSVAVATVGDPLYTPPVGTLVLQTSRAGTSVWVVTATVVA
jgi:peptidoglycan hydrolase-like protein with peptidoglycan-binding domain